MEFFEKLASLAAKVRLQSASSVRFDKNRTNEVRVDWRMQSGA
jgi:hypothetical protein